MIERIDALGERLLERLGLTATLLLTSLTFFVPLALWAEATDFVAWAHPLLPLGMVLALAWLWFARRLSRRACGLQLRQRRLELGQMSGREKRWLTAASVCWLYVAALLNAVATVDTRSLIGLAGSGNTAARVLVGAITASGLIAAVAALACCAGFWRNSTVRLRSAR